MSARGERWYAALLRLYPAEFRRRYGRAMADFHRDHVAAARAAGRSIPLLWLRSVLDVIHSALAEHAKLWTEPAAGCLVPAARQVRERVGGDAHLGLLVCGGNTTFVDVVRWTSA